MTNLKCPNCTSVLEKSSLGKYIYHCAYCGGDVDIRDLLNVTIDDGNKERYCKSAYTHIQNKNLINASKMLERLELEYPFDKDVQDLRVMYNNAYEEAEINNRINHYTNDKYINFWRHGDIKGSNIDRITLNEVTSLLIKAEKHKIECSEFRARLWILYDDIIHGNLKLNESTPENETNKFYDMFIAADLIYNDEVELKEAQEERNKSYKEWLGEMKSRIIFGSFLLITAIILLLNFSKNSGLIRLLCWFSVFIGLFFILIALLNITVYKERKSVLKGLLPDVKIQENNEKLFDDDIKEIKKELTEAYELLDIVEPEFKNITYDKSQKWIDKINDDR